MSRHKLDAKLYCKVLFGAYCEVHVDPDITNTMEPWTQWGICLGPTGNMQGSYKFLSLTTGRKITQRKFTDMPATTRVIKEVKASGAKDKAQKGLSFKDKNGVDYVFDNEDKNKMVEDRSPPSPFPDIPAEAPGIMLEHKFNAGVDKVIIDELVRRDKERPRLAAENSGLHFDEPHNFDRREVIEILDDDDDNILEIGYTKHKNIPPKVEDTPTDMIDLSVPRWANGRPQLTDGPFGNFGEKTVADAADGLRCSS